MRVNQKTQGFSAIMKMSRGSYLVEVALAFPVFLMMVLFIVWLGMAWNAKNSLVSSLGIAVRMASTRADQGNGKRLLDDVNVWLVSASPESIPTLLANEGRDGTAYEHYYDKKAGELFNDKFENLPRRYHYALVYIYQSLQQSISERLKFPCDYAGCAFCYPLHPNGDSSIALFSPNFDRKKVQIECNYYLGHMALVPITTLVNFATGRELSKRLVITRSMSFSTTTDFDEVI